MRNSTLTGIFALGFFALPGFAQQAPTAATAISSQPGKAVAAQTVKVSALVTAVDKATRNVTLKTADGRSFDVVASDQVRNFDQVKVGDELVVEYVQALSLELKKPGASGERKEDAGAVRAKAGEKPAGAVARQVTVMTEVIDVNPKNKTITLKGPKGNVVELDVQNPDQFKVVKKGDKVEAVYTEALAIAVVPAKKADAKK